MLPVGVRHPLSRALKALPGLVTASVRDDRLAGIRFLPKLDPLCNQIGICVCGLSGVRSHPMLGLTTAASPRAMKRFIPPVPEFLSYSPGDAQSKESVGMLDASRRWRLKASVCYL